MVGNVVKGATSSPAGTAGLDGIFRTGEVLGDGWSWLILRESLIAGITRFGEFQERTAIARSTLSARLGMLVDGGVFGVSSGPVTVYRPTDQGHDFFTCLMVAKRWGDRWYFSDESPLPAHHLVCGAPFHGVLRCLSCDAVLHARDVARRAAPALGTPPATARHRAPALHLLERARPCPIARTMSVIGDWWTALIIRECFFGTKQFDDFRRHLGIAPNILSGRLQRLVSEGLLAKREYHAWPSRHDYHLTDKGFDLYHVPLAMKTWGERWLNPSTRLSLTHRQCRRQVRPVLTCQHCGQLASRNDIEFL
jgi:DNA-binding HxlR family transcriptional regulator